MTFIKLPPQQLPKKPTAQTRTLTLGEHKKAFLNANNKRGFLEDDGSVSLEQLPPNTISTILLRLSLMPEILYSTLDICAQEIMRMAEGVLTLSQAKARIAFTLGYTHWGVIYEVALGHSPNLMHESSYIQNLNYGEHVNRRIFYSAPTKDDVLTVAQEAKAAQNLEAAKQRWEEKMKRIERREKRSLPRAQSAKNKTPPPPRNTMPPEMAEASASIIHEFSRMLQRALREQNSSASIRTTGRKKIKFSQSSREVILSCQRYWGEKWVAVLRYYEDIEPFDENHSDQEADRPRFVAELALNMLGSDQLDQLMLKLVDLSITFLLEGTIKETTLRGQPLNELQSLA